MRIWNKIRMRPRRARPCRRRLSACPAPADAKARKPAMWQVSDKRHDHLSVRHHPFAAPRHAMAHAPSSTRRRKDAGTLVVETIIDEKNPQPFAAELMPPRRPRRPAADPRPRPAGKARGAAGGDRQVGHSRGRRSTTWRPGRPPSRCSQVQFKELGVSRHDGVELSLQQRFTSRRQAGPAARDQCPAARLLRHPARRRTARAAGRRSRIPVAAKEQFDGMLAAWMSGDVKAIGRTFNAEFQDSPELKDALLLPPQRQLERLAGARGMQPAGDRVRRGRRRPSRRRRFGRRAAEKARL